MKSSTVVVTEHAAVRWVERVEGIVISTIPAERHKVLREATKLVTSEVLSAVNFSRKAKRKPRWACNTDYRPRANTPRNDIRYAWNVSETVCFVIRQTKTGWLVLTLVTELTE